LFREFMRPHLSKYLGVVVHACHPKLPKRLKLGRLQFLASLSKKKFETPSQWKKAGHGGLCLSSQQRCETSNRRITDLLASAKSETFSSK
jgi:hypothetical protein